MATDWKKVLADKKARLSQLEDVVTNNLYDELFTEVDNPFSHEDAGDLFTTDCAHCEIHLAEFDVVLNSNDDINDYFCERSCFMAWVSSSITNLKLFMPEVEALANS
jgi:hypothetical protein